MAPTPAQHPPRDCFAALLRALHEACGSPQYAWIAAEADKVREVYPQLASVSPPGFSKSNISMVLNGRREMLPDASWVTFFVLCCQRLGYAFGLLESDPGRSTLPGWQATLRDLEEQARENGFAVRSGKATAPELPPAAPQPRPVPLPESSARATGPIHLPELAIGHLMSFDTYGRMLLVRMLACDADAAYRSALLLATNRDRTDDVLSLLTSAAAAGHSGALALLQTSPRELDRARAAGHARRLADEARRSGDVHAADIFAECAARIANGDPAPHSTTPETP